MITGTYVKQQMRWYKMVLTFLTLCLGGLGGQTALQS